jgi:hypothetical protein
MRTGKALECNILLSVSNGRKKIADRNDFVAGCCNPKPARPCVPAHQNIYPQEVGNITTFGFFKKIVIFPLTF